MADTLHGREAVDLAKVLGVDVDVLTENGRGQARRYHDDEEIARLLTAGQGARIFLDLDDAMVVVSQRVLAIARVILKKRQPIMAVAFLCAVQKVVREYET